MLDAVDDGIRTMNDAGQHASHPAVIKRLRRLASAWWVRLLLVVVLAADLVSAPLHHHHHDSNVDGTAPAAEATHLASSLQPHVEDDGEPSVFHATTMLRVAAQALVADEPAAGTQWTAAPMPALTESLRAAEGEATVALMSSDEQPPPRRIRLSRPPEGRAPPVRV